MDSTPPIEIKPEKKVKTTVSVIVSVIAFLVVTVASATIAWARAEARSSTLAEKQEQQELRIQKLETYMLEVRDIKKDVEWIRQTMEGRFNIADHKGPSGK